MIFTKGIHLWAEIGTGTFQWLLCTTALTPLRTMTTVSTVTAHEITDGSYARQAMTGGALTYDPVTDREIYDTDDPTWVALAGGDTLGWAILAEDTGNDATDLMLGAARFVWTSNGTDLLLPVSSKGLARAHEGSFS